MSVIDKLITDELTTLSLDDTFNNDLLELEYSLISTMQLATLASLIDVFKQEGLPRLSKKVDFVKYGLTEAKVSRLLGLILGAVPSSEALVKELIGLRHIMINKIKDFEDGNHLSLNVQGSSPNDYEKLKYLLFQVELKLKQLHNNSRLYEDFISKLDYMISVLDVVKDDI